MRHIMNFIIEFYQIILLPFLSIAIFYAMEYMSKGASFFLHENGVRWKFLSFCAIMQFFVSVVIIWSVKAVFESDPLLEYQTMKMVAIILLGTTPFNISILIWVAIKLEIYRLMKNRYEKELQEISHTDSLLREALHTQNQVKNNENYKSQNAQNIESNPAQELPQESMQELKKDSLTQQNKPQEKEPLNNNENLAEKTQTESHLPNQNPKHTQQESHPKHKG